MEILGSERDIKTRGFAAAAAAARPSTRVFHFLFLESQLVLLQQPIKEAAFNENVLKVGWRLLLQ